MVFRMWFLPPAEEATARRPTSTLNLGVVGMQSDCHVVAGLPCRDYVIRNRTVVNVIRVPFIICKATCFPNRRSP